MNRIEIFFALKKIPAFRELRDTELGVIVEIVNEHRYPPKASVAMAGMPFSRLLLVVEGGLETVAGEPMPQMIGAPSLLFDWPLAVELRTNEEKETTILSLQKGRFFTLVNECPSFLLVAADTLETNAIYQRNTELTS